ncbi:MAG: peptidoglycan DD-metalloendopeptidase family protein [Acidobacteria bacterium]|nr:peptidoglycan DD-metalloendopeptidase family protein [Acidobacteriota bacterium]
MNQPYFIVVLALSLHGRLRRIHIPYQFVYAILGLAILGTFSLFGFVSSYARMAWKVANYNSLRQEVQLLRKRYDNLQKVNIETREQLATLQVFATQVSMAYGIKRQMEGPVDIASEGRLVPTFRETLAEYDFLKTAKLGLFRRSPVRLWQQNTMPSVWPIAGRLRSHFGNRTDPFTGEGAFHSGLDISAPSGTPVHVAADGVVKRAEWGGAYGKVVIVDHGNGYQTWYAHLSRYEVIPGQEVRRGQVVAYSGASGRVTSAVRREGSPVDPHRYLVQSAAFASQAKSALPF